MFETFRWIDYVCPLSLLIAFLASAPWGRKPWCMVECCSLFVFGTGLCLLPQVVMGFQVSGGKLDESHMFLARHVGAFLVGSAVTTYLNRKSIDVRMFGSQFYSRVFCSALLLLAESYSAYHLWKRKGLHFNDKFLMFACGGVSCWLLGSVVQLLRYREMGGYITKSTWLNAGFWIDHFVLLLVGILTFAFPTQMLKLVLKNKTVDGVHVCLFRCVAALLIGQGLMSNSSPGFLYARDKKAHVFGRLTTQILVFSINIFGHFVSDLFTLYNVTPFMLTGFYITFLLMLYFRFNDDKELSNAERAHTSPTFQRRDSGQGATVPKSNDQQSDDDLDDVESDEDVEDDEENSDGIRSKDD